MNNITEEQLENLIAINNAGDGDMTLTSKKAKAVFALARQGLRIQQSKALSPHLIDRIEARFRYWNSESQNKLPSDNFKEMVETVKFIIQDEVSALQNSLEAAKRDTERLDWLDKNHCQRAATLSMRASGGQTSYREAIDSAINAERKSE